MITVMIPDCHVSRLAVLRDRDKLEAASVLPVGFQTGSSAVALR